jgi:hypothetical protein
MHETANCLSSDPVALGNMAAGCGPAATGGSTSPIGAVDDCFSSAGKDAEAERFGDEGATRMVPIARPLSGSGCQLPCCGRRADDCFAQEAAAPPVLTPLLVLGDSSSAGLVTLSMMGAALGARSAPGAGYCFDQRVSQHLQAPDARLWRRAGVLATRQSGPALVFARA